MGATLDTIIGEKQSVAIKNNNITHIFHIFTIRHVIDVSHKLNSNPAWISLNFLNFSQVDWDFTAFLSLFYHKFVIRIA